MTKAEYNIRNDYIMAGLAFFFWVAGSLYVATQGLEWFMPNAASAEAESVDGLFQVMLGFATFIFLLVETTLIYLVVKFGFFRNHQDESDGPHIHGHTGLEIVWTLLPAVLVFVLTIYSYQVLEDTTEAKENEFEIQVQAQRFFWQFKYPDDEVEITSNHVLVVPENETIRLTMTSIDVIHAFWVPEFRVKNDVMPGRVSELRFTPTQHTGLPSDFELVTLDDLDIPTEDTACEAEEETATTDETTTEVATSEETAAEEEVAPALPGDTVTEAPPVDDPNGLDLVCAELCGGNHGLMRGEVYVVTREEYDAYIESLKARIIQQDAQRAYATRCGGEELKVAGRGLVEQYGCVTCHQITDAGALAMGQGPSLNGLGNRAGTRSGYDSPEDYVLTSIINPNAFIVDGYPSGLMPQTFADQIPADQLDLLVAYLLLQTEE